MGNVGWASFDVLFWLHHANIDRLSASYHKYEPDCEHEFISFQQSQHHDLSLYDEYLSLSVNLSPTVLHTNTHI